MKTTSAHNNPSSVVGITKSEEKKGISKADASKAKKATSRDEFTTSPVEKKLERHELQGMRPEEAKNHSPFGGLLPDAVKALPVVGQVAGMGEKLLEAPERIGDLVGEVGEGVASVAKGAGNVVEKLLALDIEGALDEGSKTVQRGLGTVIDVASTAGGILIDEFDYKKQIDALGDGDSFQFNLGAKLDVSVVGAKLKGGLKVTRKGDKYVVGMNAGLAGSLGISAGIGVGVKAGAKAEAEIGGGATLEMTFSSPEEAKRATRSLIQLTQLTYPVGMATGVAGKVLAPTVLRPPDEDIKLLTNNISAMELSVEGAARVGAKLGMNKSKHTVLGLGANAGLTGGHTARIEMDPKGGAPNLVYRYNMNGNADIGGSIGGKIGKSFKNGKGKDKGAIGANLNPLQAGLNGKASVTFESRVALPTGADVLNIAQNPEQLPDTVTQRMLGGSGQSIKLALDAQGSALAHELGLEASLKLQGSWDQLAKSGVIQHALQGDLEQALRSVGDTFVVDASIRPYRTSGMSLSPELSGKAGPVALGVGISASMERKDVGEPLWSFQGTPNQAANDFSHQLIQALHTLQ